MIAVDWTALCLGIAAGTLMSAIFFAGLAMGLRRALRVRNPIGLLALSAGLRIAMFLGVGWIVVLQLGPWGFAGYGVAFILCRIVATTTARVSAPARGAK